MSRRYAKTAERAVCEALEPRILMDGDDDWFGFSDVSDTPVDSGCDAITVDDTQPCDTQPADTQPCDTQPCDTQPADTQATTEPATQPIDVEPIDTGTDTWTVDTAVCADYPTISPPNAPSGLRVTAVTPFALLITWRDNSSDENGFLLARRNPDGRWQTLACLAANTTGYVDSNIQPGAAYAYAVAAFNDGGLSAYSNTAGVPGLPAPAVPDHTILFGHPGPQYSLFVPGHTITVPATTRPLAAPRASATPAKTTAAAPLTPPAALPPHPSAEASASAPPSAAFHGDTHFCVAMW